jgi:protoporphyrinogen oxidase
MDRIAVVGAGLAGLTAALRLGEQGYRVQIFERYPRPGGLARILEVGDEPLEAFYHHLFTSDEACLRLADELGVGDLIEWLPSRMGIWTDGRLWDFGTPMSLLKFRPLGWIDKLRFVAATLYLQRRADYAPFEHVTASRWVRRYEGEKVWNTVWGPLFHQKFADRAEQVAMVWLWGKMRLRGGSRSKSGMGERLGYMSGSFANLVHAVESRVLDQGGALHLSDPVRRLERTGSGLQVVTRGAAHEVDLVLVATPVPDHLEMAGHLLDADERALLESLEATGAICTVLEMNRSLTPYYWLNIADPNMPFGGLIEHTNYIPRERYGGRHILYVSNYLFPDHPLYRSSKSDVLAQYLPALATINPEFDESWIQRSHHFRADYAQPVVTAGYRERIPAMRTSADRVYLCCMAQIYPEDRGMNYAIAYGERAARIILDDLGEP